MEKAGTKLGSHILCVDSYIGKKSILKNYQQIGSELKAVAELTNAGEFDEDMMEGTCAKLKNSKSPFRPPERPTSVHEHHIYV